MTDAAGTPGPTSDSVAAAKAQSHRTANHRETLKFVNSAPKERIQ